MDGWMDGWMSGGVGGWVDGWIDGWKGRQTDRYFTTSDNFTVHSCQCC